MISLGLGSLTFPTARTVTGVFLPTRAICTVCRQCERQSVHTIGLPYGREYTVNSLYAQPVRGRQGAMTIASCGLEPVGTIVTG